MRDDEDVQEKVLVTAEEAEELLVAGGKVHCFMNPGVNLLVGADWSRKEALAEIRKASAIEIGGDSCKGMGHGLVVRDSRGTNYFLEADKEKVSAFEESYRARVQ